MAIDATLKAFLDLTDNQIAAYADLRATQVGLVLPEPTLAAVCENLALLRDQTALFVAAPLLAFEGEQTGETAGPFEP